MTKLTVSVPCVGINSEIKFKKLAPTSPTHGKRVTQVYIDFSQLTTHNATVILEDLESMVKAIRSSI